MEKIRQLIIESFKKDCIYFTACFNDIVYDSRTAGNDADKIKIVAELQDKSEKYVRYNDLNSFILWLNGVCVAHNPDNLNAYSLLGNAARAVWQRSLRKAMIMAEKFQDKMIEIENPRNFYGYNYGYGFGVDDDFDFIEIFQNDSSIELPMQ